jgi:hypothetical protein
MKSTKLNRTYPPLISHHPCSPTCPSSLPTTGHPNIPTPDIPLQSPLRLSISRLRRRRSQSRTRPPRTRPPTTRRWRRPTTRAILLVINNSSPALASSAAGVIVFGLHDGVVAKQTDAILPLSDHTLGLNGEAATVCRAQQRRSAVPQRRER